MEKPLYKVGDVIKWNGGISSFTILKVNKDSYDVKCDNGSVYKNHNFQYTHGLTRKLTKLEKALK